ncbi:MAG: hypothetical protein COA57_08875 [Flavobacteriales bacterium]|nr:MAG: hypothetical protein COA57_08875 [Flavobacteriales bacterium]
MITVSLWWMFSCTKVKMEVPEPPMALCDSLNVFYTDTIKRIIEVKCAISGCHVTGTGIPGDFISYNGVKEKVDNGTFENKTLNIKDMPPAGPLPQDELNKIQCWLDAGAANN